MRGGDTYACIADRTVFIYLQTFVRHQSLEQALDGRGRKEAHAAEAYNSKATIAKLKTEKTDDQGGEWRVRQCRTTGSFHQRTEDIDDEAAWKTKENS